MTETTESRYSGVYVVDFEQISKLYTISLIMF